MAERAAIVTGGSSGIGLAIAHVLGEADYALTVTARRPDMIQVSDIAETVRVLPRMSPGCVVPEIQFVRPGDAPL